MITIGCIHFSNEQSYVEWLQSVAAMQIKLPEILICIVGNVSWPV